MLKSLEITGFKSFAKKTTLEFNTPITGIVGPNGSGKSNAAEAFRFVLGEQSIKSLRGKRGEDLIFNGGATAGRLNRASVKLVFDNRKRLFNLDFDEVSIERVIHRDSASEYFINGSPTRLKDIGELLASAHIGASGHHIISQGEADRILNASLRERREMIEDALGLKIYHAKREESIRKLEKTEENLKQVGSLRREIAPHLRFLEKQVEKVEKARVLRTELEKFYQEYFKRESLFIEYEQKRLARERHMPDEKLKHLETELKAAKKILETGGKQDALSGSLLNLEAELRTARHTREERTREIGRLEGEIASEERNLRRERELAQSPETKTVLFKDVEQVMKSANQSLSEAAENGDISFVKTLISKVQELLHGFLDRAHRSDHPGASSPEEEIKRLNGDRERVLKILTEAEATEKELAEKINTLKNEIDAEKDQNRDAEKAVFRIMAEQNEVISKLSVITAQEHTIRVLETDWKRELGEAGVMIGHAVLDFPNFQILDSVGQEISAETIIAEDRTEQEKRRKNIERIKIRLEEAGAAGGEEIMKEYTETKERDAFLEREIADLEKSVETLTVLISDLEEKLATEFRVGVEKINTQFKQFFTLMFGGGTAGIEIVEQEKRKKKSDLAGLEGDGEESELGESDDDQEVEQGVEVNVSLPQKKIKGLMMLSGGERALTSIALLFAISQVNPPPFIILDETDAALDEANSRKYGDMIDSLSKYSQLILITHNRETMSRAGILYGITMGSEGSSKILSIKFDEALAVAK